MRREQIIRELNDAIIKENKTLILYYCTKLEQIGQSGLDVDSVKLKALTSLGHWKYTIKIYDSLGEKIYNNDSLAIGYFDALYQAERFDELFNHIAQVQTRPWLSDTKKYIEKAIPHIEKHKTVSQMESEAKLTCQAEIPLYERVKVSFLTDAHLPENIEIIDPNRDPKIILEASHLLRMLALGQRPTGIQRFIAELVHALSTFTNHIYIIYFRPEDNIPRELHSDLFLKVLNSPDAEVIAAELIFGKIKNTENNFVSTSASDKLIILDVFWAQSASRIASFIDEVQCETSLFIYDLIPLRDHSSPADSKIFKSSLKLLLNYIDKIITCSHSTRNDVEDLLISHERNIPVAALPLAVSRLRDFSAFAVEHSDMFRCTAQSFESIIDKKFLLTVSTITKRKRVEELAEAFSKTIHSHDHNLIVAGADSGADPDLTERINAIVNRHPDRIIWLGSVTDQQLNRLYEKCSFFAYLSTDEGWGLPIGEALAYGKVPLTHYRSTIPEVAGDLAFYCAEDEASIANAIIHLTTDEQGRQALEKRIKESEKRSWAEVADDFLSLILEN